MATSPVLVPTFPSHSDLPGGGLAVVETLSLSKLVANNSLEREKLFQICCEQGIFHFDLTGMERGRQLMDCVKQMFKLSHSIFSLDSKVKEEYSMLNGSVLGYKGAGVGRIDANGTPDRCEFWCMSKDDVLGNIPALPAPNLVSRSRDQYAEFIRTCHEISMVLLDLLESRLGLTAGTFRKCHRIGHISSDQTRQIRYAPQPKDDRRMSLVPHTDYGTVTVLFNNLGGLQILPENKKDDEDNWLWVKPQTGCATVNLGDAMVNFTNGLFKNPMHRVTYAPGEQADLVRYSLAYFTRPEDACLMKPLTGSALIPTMIHDEDDQVTAGEWVRTRVQAAQVQKQEQINFPKGATRGLK